MHHNFISQIRCHTLSLLYDHTVLVPFDQGLPTISSVTPSPHTAVEDTSDVLQVSVSNEEDLISVEWHFEGKPITASDKHYSFPGKQN